VTDTIPPGSRASPPRDFSDFLIELSVAVHKHAMYPEGHPSLGPAAEGVTRHAERLLGDRDVLAFGVARHQLIIEGVATDAQHPVLRRLAESLHRHHLGAVSVLRGVQPAEVGVVLRALAGDPDRDGRLPLESGQLPGAEHVRLHRLTLDGLTIVGEEPGDEESGGAASRIAELWIGLARAALAGEADDAAGDGAAGDGRRLAEPDRVADAIDRHQGAEAYDQVVVGYLLQIASELKTASGSEARTLRRRSARLISALKPETLRRLVQMGGDATRRNAFIHEAAEGMAVEAVVDLVKAAADASGQTISHGLVRMLTKLSAHAEAGVAVAKPLADSALREQVQSLLREWELADPNPDDYRRMLEYLATAPAGTGAASSVADDLNALRLVQMSLEVDTAGPVADRAIEVCLKEGKAQPLVALLEQAPAGNGVAAERLRARLTQPLTIGAIASREPLDEASLDYLMPSISIEGFGTLLDVLVSSRSRVTRRKLLDRLVNAPIDVVPLVASRLEGSEWYVQRNMLLLLGRVGRVPAGFPLARWTTHDDPRLRAEALRLQMSLPGQREVALKSAFSDVDPRVVRVGIMVVQHGCPPKVLPFLAVLARSEKVPEDLRLLAVQALGNTREQAALEALVALADGGRTIFGRRRLAAKSAVVLAALRGLAAAWRKHAKAEPLLGLAAASTDDDFRAAVH
jgi:hypothetical protein